MVARPRNHFSVQMMRPVSQDGSSCHKGCHMGLSRSDTVIPASSAVSSRDISEAFIASEWRESGSSSAGKVYCLCFVTAHRRAQKGTKRAVKGRGRQEHTAAARPSLR